VNPCAGLKAGVVSRLPSLGSMLPEMGISLARVGSKLAKVVSLPAGRGQLGWRSWSVAVAKVGNWLAFCTSCNIWPGHFAPVLIRDPETAPAAVPNPSLRPNAVAEAH